MKQIDSELKGMFVTQLCDMQLKAKDLKSTGAKSYLVEGDIGDSESDRAESSDSKSALTIEAMLNEFEIVEKPVKTPSNQSWVLDSGATSHISNDRESFSELKPELSATNVLTASGTKMPTSGSGCISIPGNKIISDVLYVPSVTKNLLSIGKLTDKGHTVVFNSKSCLILDKRNLSKVLLRGYRDPATILYRIDFPKINAGYRQQATT